MRPGSAGPKFGRIIEGHAHATDIPKIAGGVVQTCAYRAIGVGIAQAKDSTGSEAVAGRRHRNLSHRPWSLHHGRRLPGQVKRS